MKKNIGILYTGNSLGKDEKLFLKIAKKKNIELVLVNVSENTNIEDLINAVKDCSVIYNSSAEEFALEYARTLEEFGKKIIDSPDTYYNAEDKWLLFLKCKKHKIPVPETVLLCENMASAKKALKEFGKWPVVLKRVYGTMGQYVEKAENISEAENLIEKFWEKGKDRLPIIAQEMISSPSYRVTLIDGKVVQTAIKHNNGWKATGVYGKKIKKFEIDEDLEKIIEKLNKIIKIKICGVDFLKKDDRWIVLEVNSEPAFDFFEEEREKLIGLTLDYLSRIN